MDSKTQVKTGVNSETVVRTSEEVVVLISVIKTTDLTATVITVKAVKVQDIE